MKVNVKGFFKAQIVDKKGRIVGDSGWKKNTITTSGWGGCIAGLPMAHDGSYQLGYGILGTGEDAIASTAVAAVGTLNSSSDAYIALATAALTTAVSGGTARATFQYDGSLGSGDIAQVCLHSAQTTGGLGCGNTFSSSALATSQSCNVTYELRFTT